MLLTIPDVLPPAELAALRARLDGGPWIDGRRTAGWQARGVKDNAQLDETAPEAQALSDAVVRALERCKPFIGAALPLRVYPPMFNRYAAGQNFGTHVDAAIRQAPLGHGRVRSDLSATLFLNDPAEYDGGELLIHGPAGDQAVKGEAGSLVLYPASTLHRVTPVTRGTRLASILWVQSMVRDEAERTILYDLDGAIQHLAAALPDHPATLTLTNVYQNLLRRWAEC
jgi:PKHD-type hydroxylase